MPPLPVPASLALFLLDGARAWFELGATFQSWPFLRLAPRGDGHPVLIVPGLFAGDAAMVVLHEYLADRGYAPHGWEQGINVGRWEVLEPLLARFDAIRRASGRQVSLVGWSMGGLYARELARRRPEDVRLLVQLGTPFGPDVRDNPVWPLYELVSGRPAENAVRGGRATPPPPVPTVSIWSRTDSHVDWRNCVEVEPPPGARLPVANVEVQSSHQGLRHHPSVLWTVATRLAGRAG
jgi:pimeloyl-ACP methyl ester carboxylesterase